MLQKLALSLTVDKKSIRIDLVGIPNSSAPFIVSIDELLLVMGPDVMSAEEVGIIVGSYKDKGYLGEGEGKDAHGFREGWNEAVRVISEAFKSGGAPQEMYVIYSESEVGYWSNEDGWGALATATHFTEAESKSMTLPSLKDSVWEKLPDAEEVEGLDDAIDNQQSRRVDDMDAEQRDELTKIAEGINTTRFTEESKSNKRVMDLSHDELRKLAEGWLKNLSSSWKVPGAAVWRLLDELEQR